MKTTRFLFVFVVITTFLLAACGGSAPATATAPAAEQPPVVEPTTPPPTVAPVEPPPAEPTQPQYAPFCEAAPSGCEAPAITVLDPRYCVEKVPYVIMSVASGSTYESQNPDMECDDQLHSDGSLRVTCHSVTNTELISYDLQVCNSACSAPALQMGTGQCPEGYGYDSANLCCAAPAPASGDGCTTFTVDIRTCPDPQ